MTQQEAIEGLSEGHSFMSPDWAKEVCEAVGVDFSENLIERYANQKEANPSNEPKGLWLDKPNEPVEGVNTYRLSNYVADKMALKVPSFYGRGSQARANAEVIKKHLGNPMQRIPHLMK